MTKTPTYRVWVGIRDRTQNPGASGWENYGGRGIITCERWLVFENFLADMGTRPPGMTIERKDNNGPYSKDNCIWATHKEQSNNTRKNRFIMMNGNRVTVSQAADLIGMNPNVLGARLRGGWDPQEALSTPVRRQTR